MLLPQILSEFLSDPTLQENLKLWLNPKLMAALLIIAGVGTVISRLRNANIL